MGKILVMKNLLLPLLLLVSLFAQASEEAVDWQPATAEQLDSALLQFAQVAREGHFVQQKWFRFLKRPVTSSGQYQQSLGDKPQVIWQTDQPVFNKLQITPAEVRQQKEPDGSFQLLTNDVELAKLLYAVVSGDLKNYKQIRWFSSAKGCLKGELTESQWHQFVSSIELCSEGENKASLELLDSKATRTLIKLNATP